MIGVKTGMTTLEDHLAESTKAEYRTHPYSDIPVLGMHPKKTCMHSPNNT